MDEILESYYIFAYVFVCNSADPLSNFSLTFDSMEEAIAYAVKSGN